MKKEISLLDIQKMRLANNGLIYQFNTSNDCVKSLIGVQCQYQLYALISMFHRVKDIKMKDVFENKNLIKAWGQRTTLHIYHKEDYSTISSLYKSIDNWVYKYAKQLNIDYYEYLKSIEDYVNKYSLSVIDKKTIQKIIPQERSYEIMQWSGLLILASYHQILYGKLNPKDQKLYIKNDIKGKKNRLDSIVYRYFKFYGPATIEDFFHWAGLRRKDLSNVLNEVINQLSHFTYNGKKYYYVRQLPIDQIKYPIILGKFDPLLLSYKNKDWILNGKDKNIIWKKAGQVEGVIIGSKGLLGTWHYTMKKDCIIYEITYRSKIDKTTKERIRCHYSKMTNFLLKKNFQVVYKEG